MDPNEKKPGVPRERLIDRVKSVIRKPVHALLDQLFHDQVDRGGGDKSVETLHYTEVLEYAVEMRDRNPRVSATLLNRKRVEEGWSFEQVFADRNGNLVPKGRGLLGRRLRVRNFDAELEDAFEEDDTVVEELPE